MTWCVSRFRLILRPHPHPDGQSSVVVTCGRLAWSLGVVVMKWSFFHSSFDPSIHPSRHLRYTVLEGDPRYHYFSAVLKFVPGIAASTTNAMWTTTYVPVGDMGPLKHIKGIAILVFKALVGAAKANYTHSESSAYANYTHLESSPTPQ